MKTRTWELLVFSAALVLTGLLRFVARRLDPIEEPKSCPDGCAGAPNRSGEALHFSAPLLTVRA